MRGVLHHSRERQSSSRSQLHHRCAMTAVVRHDHRIDPLPERGGDGVSIRHQRHRIDVRQNRNVPRVDDRVDRAAEGDRRREHA